MGDTHITLNPSAGFAFEEIHARPSVEFVAPATVYHYAIQSDDALMDHLFGGSAQRFILKRDGATNVKFEQHTEIVSITQVVEGNIKPQDPLEILGEILGDQPVELILGIVVMVTTQQADLIKYLPTEGRLYGGTFRGDVEVRSNLRADANNIIWYALTLENASAAETGRRLQRLLELETYKTLSLFALPLARAALPKLSVLEQELSRLIGLITPEGDMEEADREALFTQMAALSGQANALQIETRFRFSASFAYAKIFQERLTALDEKASGDLQTVSGFLSARLLPAIATVQSTSQRLSTLENDVARALALLRTRMELDLTRGNQVLLKSMDARHKQQLLLSQAVEGLSVVAISYYAVSLFGYVVKGLPWTSSNAKLFTAVAIVPIFSLIWLTVRRLKKKFH